VVSPEGVMFGLLLDGQLGTKRDRGDGVQVGLRAGVDVDDVLHLRSKNL
jgi:hypothetical protein